MTIERVAVIGGTGDEGFGLASRWAAAGIEVVIGSREAAKAEAAVARLKEVVPGANARGMENAAAAASSGAVAVTVPFSGQATIYKSIAEAVQDDAVVIDCTVPVAASVGGRVTHVLGVWQGSAAQQAASILKKKGIVCAAFHSLAAVALNDLEKPVEGDVLACGPKAGKGVVRELVEAIPDLRFVDAGPLETARLIEPITSVLVGLNHRYKVDRTGIRIVGLPEDA